ncbi:MAG: hypothetical protein KatS3mg015_2306 [Fimbriimonadales bacterium]|nr:MAG: hypothetical protein KatS3mg015_2306 [Fimbriimonadales bacterium]
MITAVLAGVLIAQPAQTGGVPTSLIASAPLIRGEVRAASWGFGDEPWRISCQPVKLSISCDAPYWRLLCAPQRLTSPTGAQADLRGTLNIVSSGRPPWAPQSPGEAPKTISLGPNPALVGEGISTAIAPGIQFEVTPTILVDPLTPAGEWQADLRFTLIGPDGNSILAEQNVRIQFNLPPVGMILFDRGPLSVHAGRPGDHECDKPLRFRAVSNRTNLRVRVVLPSLLHEGGKDGVGPADIAIAVGSSPADSLARLRQTPYGVNSVIVTVGRGVTEQFVSVRIRSTLSMPPGQYQGVVTAEVMG